MLYGFLFYSSPLGGAAESFILAVVFSSSFKLNVNNISRSFYPKFLLVSFLVYLVEASRGFSRSGVPKCFLIGFKGKEGRKGPRFPFNLHIKGRNVGNGIESVLYSLYLSRSYCVNCLLGYVYSANNLVNVIQEMLYYFRDFHLFRNILPSISSLFYNLAKSLL